MAISSIDEILMGGGGNSQQPNAPEYQEEPEPVEEMEGESPEYDDSPESQSEDDHTRDSDSSDGSDDNPEDDHTKKEYDEDEYGNKKERMSQGMKDRLDRKEKQRLREVEERDREIAQLRSQLANQGASREVQKAAQDFEYNPDADGDWKQQLAQFVRHEVSAMTRDEQEKVRRNEEDQQQAEFREKFRNGMDRFADFVEVVNNQPLDDAMTVALRGMDDPAAFIYAAAKRNPQELERISKLRDPYARMVEMGKLEERMRKNKPTTKAPRPLGRAPEDALTNVPKKQKEPNGDDLLAKADAKRLSTVRTRLRGNR